ncbi:hypothetical protein F5148DRAFT_1170005 [Russula earlei]|uniref:Uncharacterized protein n=1 Tax=Russula earlei TaxID=71964 RepID=A0ACC0UJR4_9AGAM|nr:hypothetical protein F5148DRAFT_1170005 [Russula earlei]
MHRKPAPVPQQDFVGFIASLRMSLPTVAMIAQEILLLYTLWERYSGAAPESGLGVSAASGVCAGDDVVTPVFLTQLLLCMREACLVGLAHPASGQPMATDKRLGRTQAGHPSPQSWAMSCAVFYLDCNQKNTSVSCLGLRTVPVYLRLCNGYDPSSFKTRRSTGSITIQYERLNSY